MSTPDDEAAVDRLSAGPGQLVMPIGEQTEHLGVISRPNRMQLGVTHRDHRSGAGIVGVALVVVTGVEQPHPSRQRRRNIEDGLADTGGRD